MAKKKSPGWPPKGEGYDRPKWGTRKTGLLKVIDGSPAVPPKEWSYDAQPKNTTNDPGEGRRVTHLGKKLTIQRVVIPRPPSPGEGRRLHLREIKPGRTGANAQARLEDLADQILGVAAGRGTKKSKKQKIVELLGGGHQPALPDGGGSYSDYQDYDDQGYFDYPDQGYQNYPDQGYYNYSDQGYWDYPDNGYQDYADGGYSDTP